MSFKDHFPFEVFLDVVSWEKFNPRPAGAYNSPESDAWYSRYSAFWEHTVTPRLMMFVQSWSQTGKLKPITNHSNRERAIYSAWQKIMDGTITGEYNSIFSGLESMLRQSIMITSHTPGIEGYESYRRFITAMDAGNYPWYMTSIHCRCDRTGESLSLNIVDWEPSWGRSINGQFDVVEDLPPEVGYREVEIEFKTGNLLCDDWFRIDGFTELFSDDYQINYTHGQVARTLGYLKQDFLLVGAGNCTVYAYSPSATDKSSIVFNYGDGSYWDSDEDEELNDTRGHDVGSISCGHWAVGVIEYETLIEKLTPRHGADTQRIIDEYLEHESDGCRIQIAPGRYRLIFQTNGNIRGVMQERGIDNLGCNDPLFVLTKLD